MQVSIFLLTQYKCAFRRTALHPINFSPTLQSEAEQVTDVPVTGLISKTNEHGCVSLNYIPAA